MIEVSFNGSDETFIAQMRAKGPRILSVLRTKLQIIMFELQTYIQDEKLSGQVLKVRTGHLRQSVESQPIKVDGSIVTGEVQAAAQSGPAWYGQLFEYGDSATTGTWVVPTKARALRFVNSAGEKVFAMRVLRKPITARPFMAPSLVEQEEAIRKGISDAVQEALE